MRIACVTLCVASIALAAHVVPAPSAAAVEPTPPRVFVATVACDEQGGIAHFVLPNRQQTLELLSPYGYAGRVPDEVWIDISLQNNNFAPGTFLGAGPFITQEEAQSHEWRGLLQLRHYYRLNARLDDRWVELGRGIFETPNCGLITIVGCVSARPALFGFDPLAQVFFRPPALNFAGPSGALAGWIDISLVDNGFQRGTFIGAGPFTGDTVPFRGGLDFRWTGIKPGLRHYYRYNVLWGDGVWRAFDIGSFWVPECDRLPQPPAPVIDRI